MIAQTEEDLRPSVLLFPFCWGLVSRSLPGTSGRGGGGGGGGARRRRRRRRTDRPRRAACSEWDFSNRVSMTFYEGFLIKGIIWNIPCVSYRNQFEKPLPSRLGESSCAFVTVFWGGPSSSLVRALLRLRRLYRLAEGGENRFGGWAACPSNAGALGRSVVAQKK